MPVFNEAASIIGTLDELVQDPRFSRVSNLILLDDCSTDQTWKVINEWLLENSAISSRVTLLKNSENIGHGPSTMRLWGFALSLEPDYVLVADGDGEVNGSVLFDLLDQSERNCVNIIGCRTNRRDPSFRKIFSLVTQGLVLYYSRRWPCDANSPYRALEGKTLGNLRDKLGAFDTKLKLPNVYMTALLLEQDVAHEFTEVEMRQRPDGAAQGSTWQAATSFLPSKKMLKFAGSSFVEAFGVLSRLKKSHVK